VAAPLMFLLCATALSQNATDLQRREDSERYRHIVTTEPRRPNKPLRQDNITDEEVREVQRAALEVYPDSIVSISGVTDGCDCEDGSNCTAQCKAGGSNTVGIKAPIRASEGVLNRSHGSKKTNVCSIAFPPVQSPRLIGCW
jgi:hypothetical protein